MSKHILAPGFANIPLRDLPLWVKVFKNEGIAPVEEMQRELTLIDDLLTLQKPIVIETQKTAERPTGRPYRSRIGPKIL